MAGVIFILGVIILLVGILIVAKNAFGKELASLASTTSKLAQKGIAEDIAGLVGNASALMDNLQKMVSTAAGIGVLLISTGTIFITGSILIFMNIDKFPTYVL
jgi:hypothetical protein